MTMERKLNPQLLKLAFDEIETGQSVRATARKYGVTHTTLNRLMRIERPELPQYGKFKRRTLSLPTVSTDLAYIAGIIDGEGSISRNGRGWCVVVYNTNEDLMSWLTSFGGRRYTRAPTNNGFFTTKPQYGWVVGRLKDLEYLLEEVMPYLRIKRSKAEEVLALTKAKLYS